MSECKKDSRSGGGVKNQSEEGEGERKKKGGKKRGVFDSVGRLRFLGTNRVSGEMWAVWGVRTQGDGKESRGRKRETNELEEKIGEDGTGTCPGFYQEERKQRSLEGPQEI